MKVRINSFYKFDIQTKKRISEMGECSRKMQEKEFRLELIFKKFLGVIDA